MTVCLVLVLLVPSAAEQLATAKALLRSMRCFPVEIFVLREQ